ncbi:MAG: RNA methyltransferase [Cyanobacteria bacterium P01_D01_bin.71]
MDIADTIAVMGYLESFVTPQRSAKIDAVLAQRTRHLTVVVEDFHDSHNASALLRTCEGLGIQDVHVVENFNTFKAGVGAASGAEKWVTRHHYSEAGQDNTLCCCAKLRSQGYSIVATSPHLQARSPEIVPLDQKLAIIFGSECYGVSEQALATADWHLKIPMVGFVESLNVSVSAAMCLYTLTRRLRAMNLDWALSDHEKLDLRLDWIRQSVQHGEALERHFWAQRRKNNGVQAKDFRP